VRMGLDWVVFGVGGCWWFFLYVALPCIL